MFTFYSVPSLFGNRHVAVDLHLEFDVSLCFDGYAGSQEKKVLKCITEKFTSTNALNVKCTVKKYKSY